MLLEPTEIYVKPVLELLRSEVEVRGLAHITSGGLGNLLRLDAEVGYEIDDPLPVPPVFELIRERGDVPDEEMHDVFNMGCGFCCVVAPADEEAALELLRAPLPDAKRIGGGRSGGRDPPRLSGAPAAQNLHGARLAIPAADGHPPLKLDDRNRALRPLPAGGEAGQRRHVDGLPGAATRPSTARSRSR